MYIVKLYLRVLGLLGQDKRMVAVLVAVGTQTIADIGYMYLNPRIRFR